jgi:hypothetical protein
MPKASGESKAEVLASRSAAVAASYGDDAGRTLRFGATARISRRRLQLMNLNAFLSETDIYHRFRPKWAISGSERSIARRSHPFGSAGDA